MAKRAKLGVETLRVAKPAEVPTARPDDAEMRVTSIHIPRDLLRLLRIAAAIRADRQGGRPSVSAVIVDVLERHRDEIEAETRL